METLTIKTHIGKDGVLKIEMPIGVANIEAEVVIIYPTQPEDDVRDHADWIAFVNRTYGALVLDPIERPPALPLEVREELEDWEAE